MRFTSALLLLAAGAAHAASSWGFDEGSVSVLAKKGSEGVKAKKFDPNSPITTPIALGSDDTLKVSFKATENGKRNRPHQAFVVLKEEDSGLEAPFPLTVKESGTATVSISQKDIPVQLLLSSKPLKASVVLASFGSTQGLIAPAFDLEVKLDPSAPAPSYEKPLRYGKLPEIHHIFRSDPRSPPKVISLFFALAVLVAVLALFIGWLVLGANVNHLTKAISAAPFSHASFFGSIIAMEFVFFMYYSSWNLFQTLPVIGIVGIVSILSGTKALGEVQSRRHAGER